jgi:hypothetical protein
MGMIGAGEMVKLRGPQRPSLRLQPFCSLATSAVPSATASATYALRYKLRHCGRVL